MNLKEIVSEALKEDIGAGDFTSLATIGPEGTGIAKLVMKSPGVIAGVAAAKEVFHQVDPELELEIFKPDGSVVEVGDMVFQVKGKARSILMAERTALNFMQRLSGIATQTRQVVQEVRDTGVTLLDTRKTTPLLRDLEKEAVRLGGAKNHRMGLYDMIMIKDNHVDYAGGIEAAIRAVNKYQKENNLKLAVELEVRNFEELLDALNTGMVDRIMLDNFSTEDIKTALELVDGRVETEASGGITIDNIRAYAETGVDYISLGSLTHQIASLDMSLKAVIKRFYDD